MLSGGGKGTERKGAERERGEREKDKIGGTYSSPGLGGSMCPCDLEGVVVKVRNSDVEGRVRGWYLRVRVRVSRHIDVIERRVEGVNWLRRRIGSCEEYESLCKLRNINPGVAMALL